MEQSEKRVKQQTDAAQPLSMGARPDNLALEPASRVSPKDAHPQNREVQGVYIISVAARLLEMHPQTLRKYERLGLVRPARTVGMLRLYSDQDLKKLRLIRYLETERRMNLAGVEFILSLLEQLLEMRQRVRAHNGAQAMDVIMKKEMQRLFRQLDLPFSL